MAKGDSEVKQESTFKLSPEQQQIVQLAMPWLRQYASNPPAAPSGTAIAPFNPIQQSAQQGILNAIPGMQKYANSAGKASQFLFSGDVLDPNTNPGLRGAIDASTRPIIEQATTQLLPAIRGDAVSSGQYSGTRKGLVENQLAEDTLRQVGDTSNQLVNQTYGANLEAMQRGLALAPQTQQMMLQPALTANAVGDVQQQMAQAQATEQWNQARTAEQWPMLLAQQLLGASMQIPGGTNVSTGSQSGGGNSIGQILGGAASIIPSLFAFL